MSDYTRANFAQLQASQADFLNAFKELTSTLDELEGDLESRLAQWEGGAKAAYFDCKRQWDQAAQHLGTVLNSLGQVIGTANENYSGAERSNTSMWGG